MEEGSDNQASIIMDPPLQVAEDESDHDYERGPRDSPEDEEDEDEEMSSGSEDDDGEAYSSGRSSPQYRSYPWLP